MFKINERPCERTVIDCGSKSIAEGIGDAYRVKFSKERGIISNGWNPASPVFISAQTAKGKNYFVEKKLIRYVSDFNSRYSLKNQILILTNRVALWRQQINHLHLGNEVRANIEEESYSYGDIVRVATYHSFFNTTDLYIKRQSSFKTQYLYVVCDEAHFFTSDASFNPHTHLILDEIATIFKNSIRIYMSATPDECLRFIMDAEEQAPAFDPKMTGRSWDATKFGKNNVPAYYPFYEPMRYYEFSRDYSYLNTIVFSKISDLYDIIIDSITTKNEKWLIFINSRYQCEKIKKELEYRIGTKDKDEEDPIFFASSDRKNDKRYRQILSDEKLGSIKILLSTSVLDNGVNLADVRNIVVTDVSPVECVQMAGRARVKTDYNTGKYKEKKNLYLKRSSQDDIIDMQNELLEQRQGYTDYATEYANREAGYMGLSFFSKYYNGSAHDWTNGKHWFGRSKVGDARWHRALYAGPLYINLIAKEMTETRLSHLDALLEKESKAANNPQYKEGQILLDEQLKCFGKDYNPDHDVDIRKGQPLITFMTEHAGDVISGDSIEEFKCKFKKLHDSIYGCADKNTNRSYGMKKINAICENLHITYRIVSEHPEIGPWTIVHIPQEAQPAPKSAPASKDVSSLKSPVIAYGTIINPPPRAGSNQ